MQLVDSLMIILACTALVSGVLVIFKVRDLKARFVEEHLQSIDQLLTAVGDIESVSEARRRAPIIVEVMKRYGAVGLMIPLKSGGRVDFRLSGAGLSVKGE
jgi:hypothetical protein